MKRITPSQKIFIQFMMQKQEFLNREQAKKKAYEEAFVKEQIIKQERKRKFLDGIGKTNQDVLL